MGRTFKEPPKVERWRRIEHLVREDIEKAGIEMVPANLPELIAKIHTGEITGGKGIFFIGPTGTGKSRRLELAAQLFGIEMVSANDLVRRLMRAETDTDMKEILRSQPCRYDTGEHFHDLIIDDLGIEPEEQVIYGTRLNLMLDAIEERYKVFTDIGRRWRTHFTSNLSKDEIHERYGERIWSRLNEMVVFVTLTGEDRRLEK